LSMFWEHPRQHDFGSRGCPSLGAAGNQLCIGLRDLDQHPEVVKPTTHHDWFNTPWMPSNENENQPELPQKRAEGNPPRTKAAPNGFASRSSLLLFPLPIGSTAAAPTPRMTPATLQFLGRRIDILDACRRYSKIPGFLRGPRRNAFNTKGP